MTNQWNLLPQLRVIPGFIKGEELLTWQRILFDDSFWQGSDKRPGMLNYASPTMPAPFEDLEASLVDKIAQEVEAFFGFEMITAPYPGFRKWIAGGYQDLHLDHADFGSSRQIVVDYVQPPNRRWPRCLNEYATVLYWNDGFDGGNIYFARSKNINDVLVEVVPEPGMLIMFPCSEDYAHGVRQINSGERVICTHFWTKAQTAATLAKHIDVAEEAVHRRYGYKVKKRLTNGFLADV